MKKRYLIVFAAVLLLVFSGCGQNQRSPEISEGGMPQEDNSISSQQEEETTSLNDSSALDNYEGQDFTNLELEIAEGTLYVRSGDSFSLTLRGKDVTDYEISDSTLYFKNSHAGDVVLVLPKEESYETFRLTVTGGHVYTEDSLEVQALELEMRQGEAKLETISVASNSNISVEQGSAFLSGNLGPSINASCREGHLSLEVSSQQTDFNYEISLSEGELRLGKENYHGKSDNRTIDNGAESSMQLSCSRGDISVEFE